MPNRGKAIGNAWERDVCKIMESVFKLSFKRVPTSGAMTGGINAKILEMLSETQKNLLKGDIIPPDEMPKLLIECKKRKTFSFSSLFSQNKELEGWIDQNNDVLDKLPECIDLIILKVNNKGHYILYNDILPLKSQTNILTYQYNEKVYILTKFDENWIKLNQQILLKIAK